MILKKGENFVKGYIRIEVEGFYIERFFNMCANENIHLWGTQRKNKTSIITNVERANIKEIRNIAQKVQCTLKIKNKKGIPFIIKKYKNRKVFIFLFFMLMFTIFALSNFIWNIEISGNTTIKEEEILAELNDSGIKQGIWKHKIDTQKVIEKVRLEDERISWIGIDIVGTNVKVTIVEATQKPAIIDENEYCDIVAEKEGIINKINVTNGTALVQEGEVIEKGQKLIGGWMEGKYTGVRYMHASGDIEAKVWYTQEKEEKFVQEEKVETSTQENKYAIIVNKKTINLFKRLSKFEKYDTIETKNKIKISNNFYLPIEFKKITNYEYKLEEKSYTKEGLQDKIINELEQQIEKDIDGKTIVNRNVNVEEKADGLKVKLIYEVIENVGVEQKLVS